MQNFQAIIFIVLLILILIFSIILILLNAKKYYLINTKIIKGGDNSKLQQLQQLKRMSISALSTETDQIRRNELIAQINNINDQIIVIIKVDIINNLDRSFNVSSDDIELNKLLWYKLCKEFLQGTNDNLNFLSIKDTTDEDINKIYNKYLEILSNQYINLKHPSLKEYIEKNNMPISILQQPNIKYIYNAYLHELHSDSDNINNYHIQMEFQEYLDRWSNNPMNPYYIEP